MNIKDVAKKAGVGVSTVSRVLNNNPDVKESTREKIQQVIKEMNYIPNNSARILKQTSTKNIGVYVKGIYNPFFSEMINIIADKISEQGYSMILSQNNSKFDDFDSLASFIKEKRLQGVICLGGVYSHINEEILDGLNIPVIFTSVDNILEESEYYSSITIDNINASYEATKYLVNLGHRKIACLLGEKTSCSISKNRLRGYKKAFEEFEVKFDEGLVIYGDYTYSGAYNKVINILEERRDITAIFCISDVMAVGAAKAITDSKLNIGEDISVIGFDGMDISKYYNPSITTIKQPQKLMAEESIGLLFNIINNINSNKREILETVLLERESVKKLK